MKNLFVFASVLLVSSMIMWSCSKDETIAKKVQEPISVVEGRLVFESHEKFNETVQFLLGNQENIGEWKSQYNYTSLIEAYHQISEVDKRVIGETLNEGALNNVIKLVEANDGEIEVVPVIDNNIFKILFNHQGVLQIGQKILKQDYEFLRVINDGDIAKLSNINNYKESNKEMSIDVFPIIRTQKGTYGFDHHCRNDYSSKKRLKGTTSYDHNGIWMSLNASTKNYRKRFGIWWLSKTNGIHLGVHAKYTFSETLDEPLLPNTTTDEDIHLSQTRNNKSEVDHTFEYCDLVFSHYSCYVDTEIMDGTHKVGSDACTTTY